MEIFELGQVVRLKSGGPKMTIKGDDDGAWACQWFDRNGRVQNDSFPEDMLEIFIKSQRY